MGDELWKEGYGIKFKEFKDKPDQPDVASPTDAIPARNSIWDSQNAYDLDQVVLHGFTIADLIDLGALAATNEETNVLPNNLAGDVHPAFAIDKWETSVPIHFKRKHMFPLSNNFGGLPRPGNYTANNLLVWKALLPCLRLASKFVENAHIFPWYAAFLHSDIHPVAHTTAEAKKLAMPLRKLYLRRESDLASPAVAEDTRERIAAISKNICLGISDGKAVPTGANSNLKVNYDGVAIPPWEDDGKTYRIYLAYQIIEPLLEDKIRPSTKLALQFHVALTLLHEFAHVLVFAKDGARHVKLYLDNERISEAGFSFEMNTFGGHPVLLLQHTNAWEYGGMRAAFLLEDWLGTAKGHQWTTPLSGTDADWNDREWREARSIPISFLEELGQEDFWRCFVGRWGAEALKVYPWTEGRLVKRSGHALKTIIHSTPKQDRAWLEAAQQVTYKNLGPLTPDEVIAVRIANRRISREKEINRLVKTRRRLEQQKGEEQSEATPPPQVGQEDNAPEETLQEDNPSAVVTAQPWKQTPWQIRAENIEVQKDLLNHQIYLCAQENERVQNFLKRKDVGTPEYLKIQKDLIDSNTKECKYVRKLAHTAVNNNILSGYEQLLENYEYMRGLLGRVSRQSSEGREFEKTRKATRDECAALLRRAPACRDRGEHKKCCDYCKEILVKDDVSHYLRASAFLLLALSTTDREMKVWYLSEAVRVYKLMEHVEGETLSDTIRTMTQHAEERLKEVKAEHNAAKAAAAKASLPGPKIISEILPGKPPKTPPNPKGPKAADNPIGKKTRKPFTGFGNPPSSPPTPPINLDPAPKGMSSFDVIRHRRTFKVINQARRNFFNGDYDLAERGYLELLNLEGTSAWQKARCQVFLASIQTRNDRAERAKTALNMYRGFLKEFPEDQRRIVAVREAEKLEKRVLAELEREKGAIGGNETENGHAGLGNGHTGLGNGHTGLETISEVEGSGGIERENEETKQRDKEKERVGFVAGVVGKVAGFLGLKRRREEDDDGEDERGGSGRRAAPFS